MLFIQSQGGGCRRRIMCMLQLLSCNKELYFSLDFYQAGNKHVKGGHKESCPLHSMPQFKHSHGLCIQPAQCTGKTNRPKGTCFSIMVVTGVFWGLVGSFLLLPQYQTSSIGTCTLWYFLLPRRITKQLLYEKVVSNVAILYRL